MFVEINLQLASIFLLSICSLLLRIKAMIFQTTGIFQTTVLLSVQVCKSIRAEWSSKCCFVRSELVRTFPEIFVT